MIARLNLKLRQTRYLILDCVNKYYMEENKRERERKKLRVILTSPIIKRKEKKKGEDERNWLEAARPHGSTTSCKCFNNTWLVRGIKSRKARSEGSGRRLLRLRRPFLVSCRRRPTTSPLQKVGRGWNGWASPPGELLLEEFYRLLPDVAFYPLCYLPSLTSDHSNRIDYFSSSDKWGFD